MRENTGGCWGDFLHGPFGSQESLEWGASSIGGGKAGTKGSFWKGQAEQRGDGFASLSYCYPVLATREELPLF